MTAGASIFDAPRRAQVLTYGPRPATRREITAAVAEARRLQDKTSRDPLERYADRDTTVLQILLDRRRTCAPPL